MGRRAPLVLSYDICTDELCRSPGCVTVDDASEAWAVSFRYGRVANTDKTEEIHLRCVRGGS